MGVMDKEARSAAEWARRHDIAPADLASTTSFGNEVCVCGASTGHVFRPIAMCDSEYRAEIISDALRRSVSTQPAWLPIEQAKPEPFEQIVILLAPTRIGFAVPSLLGEDVRQIAEWNDEGALLCRGRKIPLDTIDGFIPLPRRGTKG